MNWYSGTIPEAVDEARRNNKLFLVYIEGTDEMSRNMSATYNDPTVAAKLTSDNIIALKLVANSVPYVQFCQIYPVLVIPSSFFICGNGAPIEIITGNLSPAEFSNKVDKVLELYEKSCSEKKRTAPQPTVSATSSSTVSDVPTASAQQNESGTSEYSTSEPVEDSESTSLQNKVERAKLLVEAQRQKKAAEEQEKERQQEIERRNMGKAMQQAQKSKHETELQEWAKNRAKEKEEERLAKERVKAMIAQDRAERAAKYQRTKEAEQAEQEKLARQREETERAMRNAAMSSNDARIQFRLPDGSYNTHSFSADSSLEEVRRFVIEEVRPPFSHFSLCTTFPRRHFTESNYSESLRDLQLAPSAVLLILPAQAVSSVSQSTGFLTSIFWMVLSPLTSVWNFIRSLFPGGSPEPAQPTPSSSSTTVQPPTRTTQAATDNSRPPNQRKESSFAKREGNIFRINNQSDDDENNTWNGNSTQQM